LRNWIVGAHDNARTMDGKPILLDLGRRLREARLRAGVSRRYATDAEAGRANVSVLKLADLARAAGVPTQALLDGAAGSRRGERIALLGLRGAGKSAVGRKLALALEVPFVELDERVEEIAQEKLAGIFSVHGEAHFHRLEREALENVLAAGERSVIATSGSIVAVGETFARLRATCRTVWLRAQPEEHFQRVVEQGDRRPMTNRPRAMAELEAILASREPLYAQCEFEVSTSKKSLETVVRDIQQRLGSP
jgi:XRE family aerobic/anaerobic benzoate catabolism transcriptional regulator